jgi:hypothetical protein
MDVMHTQLDAEEAKGQDNFRDLGVDGRIILN